MRSRNNSFNYNMYWERKIQAEKLSPMGRFYLENYKPVRLNETTVILQKPEDNE